jgi:RimJ/RimL family protein N-acetyltransferase
MFRGEKVFIRPMALEDLPYVMRWRNDGELAKYIWPGMPTPTPVAKQREWYDQMHADENRKVFSICEAAGQHPIGIIGFSNINPKNQSGYLFIWIGESAYWGRGFGSEAMVLFLGYGYRILNLRRIILEVYDYNERAIKAYEKVGFVKEGKVRRSIFKDGRYVDEYVMSMLKDEYFTKYPIQRWGEESLK